MCQYSKHNITIAQLHNTPYNAPSTYMYARTYNVPAGFYLITYVIMYVSCRMQTVNNT